MFSTQSVTFAHDNVAPRVVYNQISFYYLDWCHAGIRNPFFGFDETLAFSHPQPAIVYSFPFAFIVSDKVIAMTALHDKIYGREINTGIRKVSLNASTRAPWTDKRPEPSCNRERREWKCAKEHLLRQYHQYQYGQ